MKSGSITAAVLLVFLSSRMACAQSPSALGRAAPASAQQAAPFDLTGYWVAVVTEDWRWRMLTPPKGDFASVPLNAEGRRVANQFDPAKYGAPTSAIIDCRAYGAGGVMRMPTRLHITWSSPDILKVETDWGEQTRMFYFDRRDIHADSQPSLQGTSVATWEHWIPVRSTEDFNPPSVSGGYLKVMTTNLAPGWLRRNGVPYSAQTRETEYFHTFTDPVGRQWFDVTTEIDDPVYLESHPTFLTSPFTTSSEFRKEPDGSKWAPHPCKS